MTTAKVNPAFPPYEAPAPVDVEPVEAAEPAEPVTVLDTPSEPEWISPREKAQKEVEEALAALQGIKSEIELAKGTVKRLERQLQDDENRLRELRLSNAPDSMTVNMKIQVDELVREIQTLKMDYENGQTAWKFRSAETRLKYAERNLRDEQAKVWR